jgi:YbbR domain-containing protein
MKEKLTKNLAMKLLSLFIAALAWIVIINIDDPVITKRLSNVPVEILNEDAIQSLNQVYEVVEGDTVDIRVKGKRSEVTKLKATDLVVNADLENHNDLYVVPILVTCPKYDGIDCQLTGSVQALKITLENIETTQVKITVIQEGEAAKGYHIGSALAKPNMIEVSGGKSLISRISEVRVYLNVNNVSEDFSEKLVPRAFDQDGEELDSERIAFNTSEILVAVQVLETKTVPISLEIVGEPSYGYKYIKNDYDPKQIVIAGRQNVLNGIKSIPISVDIQGKSISIEKAIDLSENIPEAVMIVGDDRVVTLKVSLEKMITTDFKFTTNDIKLNNIPKDMKFNFEDAANRLSVKIMGLEEDLSELKALNLEGFIDLKGLAAGSHSVEINFDLEDKYLVLSKPKIKIQLTDGNEIPASPQTSSEDETTAASETPSSEQRVSDKNTPNPEDE